MGTYHLMPSPTSKTNFIEVLPYLACVLPYRAAGLLSLARLKLPFSLPFSTQRVHVRKYVQLIS